MVGEIQVPSEEPPDAAIPQEGFSGYSRRGGDQSHHTESTWGFRCVRWFQGNFFTTASILCDTVYLFVYNDYDYIGLYLRIFPIMFLLFFARREHWTLPSFHITQLTFHNLSIFPDVFQAILCRLEVRDVARVNHKRDVCFLGFVSWVLNPIATFQYKIGPE